jgi:outer membrane protein OmpA-like peptidoglycan-associated protein/tetratricopeptide (TPR) repeat protein
MIRSLIYRLLVFHFLFLVLCPAVSLAQHEIKVPRSSLKVKNEGFLDALDNITMGDKWARKGLGALNKANEYYLKAHDYNPACAELNYKVGVCYYRTGNNVKALEFFKAAFDKKSENIPDVSFMLARAYHLNMEFDKAKELYESYYQSLKDKAKEKQSPEIYGYIDNCKNGKLLMEAPKRYIITNLGTEVNSSYDDYFSVLEGNDSLLFFVSRRPNGKHPKPGKLDYQFDEDIYFSLKKDGKWGAASYLEDDDFNSRRHDAMVWVSYDGKTRYIYDGHKRNGDFYYSDFKKGEWTSPRRLPRGFNSKGAETSLSITRNGKVMYFVSDNPEQNFGGKDIYYARQNAKGKWEKPKNLGNVINTKFDEEAVYIHPDGKILYFSSKGHNSMGGYDIFRSEIDQNGNWSKPVNMGYPLNTPDDDLFYRPFDNEKKAYFSSTRPDTKGGLDLYQVIILGAEKKMMMRTEEQLIAYFDKPVSDMFSKKTEELQIDSSFVLKGVIMDAADKHPLVAKLELIDMERSQVVGTTMSDSTGAYKINFTQVKNYGVEINAKEYMFYLDVVNMPAKPASQEILKNFALNKVKVGTKVVLKNIYFETGKAVLTQESNLELDKLVKFLLENTEFKIEISGHTDNVGGAAYNTTLSANRAQAVVDYFVAHGIAREQLVAKGYGPTQPISPNTTAAGRKLNRRVEFKILSTE